MGTEKDNVVKLHKDPATTVEVEAHPEEVADVDAETLAIMKARLEGIDFEELYDNEDVRLVERRLEVQRKLLFGVFTDPENLRQQYVDGILKDEVLREVRYARVDLKFIGDQVAGFNIQDQNSVIKFLAGKPE